MAAVVASPSAYWLTGGGQSYSLLSNDKAGLSYRVRRELKKRGFLTERNTIPPLAAGGIGVGGSINANYNRIGYTNNVGNVGNPIPPVPAIETVTTHTGMTTAGDAAVVAGLAALTTQPAYQRNGDGNPRGNNGG